MRRFLKTRGVELAVIIIALTALMPEPAWATTLPSISGPPAGMLAGGAIIGALVIAKWWRSI